MKAMIKHDRFAMTLLMFIAMLCLAVTASASAFTLAHLWSQRFGSSSDEEGYGIATDALGNVFVTGFFNGTVNFGGTNLVSAGSGDIFVAKYNSSGLHQWSQRFGSTVFESGEAIAVDGSGNVFVTGYFAGPVNFGGGNLVSAGNNDIFLAKFDANGVHQWSQRFGGTFPDRGLGVAVDGSGNVVVTGYFDGTVDFGGANLVSAGPYDVFVAKYNASGMHQWSRGFGSTGMDTGSGVAVDGSGNVFVTGDFVGTVNFGGANLVSAGFDDIFLAKYNASGVHQWSKRFGGTGHDGGGAVATLGGGFVAVTGIFNGTVNLGGANLVSAGGSDVFVASYNTFGVHIWSRSFGDTSNDWGQGVVTDGYGNVFATGYFQGTLDCGGGGLTSAGGNDIFVAKYSANGTHEWSERVGDTDDDEAWAVGVDGSGNAVVTGCFMGTASFGGTTLVSAGSEDIFLAKYSAIAAEPAITSILDVGNDQGRKVRIQFSRSGNDDLTAMPVFQYEAYRRNDAVASSMVAEPAGPLSRARLLDQGWVYAGDVPAHGVDVYVMDASTDADSSIALGQHYSAFFIRGATADPLSYYDSPIDSGYSVDNLAPGVPGGFAYSTGVLSWKKSTAEDFAYFSVYGSNTNAFATATLVDYCATLTMDVNMSPYVFYFVTATDFSGNEGKPAVVNTLTGAGGTPSQYVLSISSYPNPFNPATTIRYTVPSKGHVEVGVYDARGAHVATLVNEEKAVGAYTQAWSGRDDKGQAVSSGVYFARVTHPQGTRSYKMVLLK